MPAMMAASPRRQTCGGQQQDDRGQRWRVAGVCGGAPTATIDTSRPARAAFSDSSFFASAHFVAHERARPRVTSSANSSPSERSTLLVRGGHEYLLTTRATNRWPPSSTAASSSDRRRHPSCSKQPLRCGCRRMVPPAAGGGHPLGPPALLSFGGRALHQPGRDDAEHDRAADEHRGALPRKPLHVLDHHGHVLCGEIGRPSFGGRRRVVGIAGQRRVLFAQLLPGLTNGLDNGAEPVGRSIFLRREPRGRFSRIVAHQSRRSSFSARGKSRLLPSVTPFHWPVSVRGMRDCRAPLAGAAVGTSVPRSLGKRFVKSWAAPAMSSRSRTIGDCVYGRIAARRPRGVMGRLRTLECSSWKPP